MPRFVRGICASFLLLFAPSPVGADGQPGAIKNIEEVDGSPSCFGYQLEVSNGTLTDNGDGTCTVTTGGGGGNSFETIDVPAGTDPVAASATDTLTITETSFLTITGTAATDTLDITQVTTDLGTDGLIAANAVALGTDTTGNYVSTVGDCTAGETSLCFNGASGTVLTFEGDAGADQTLTYDTTDDDFELNNDLTIEDATPHLQLIDSTASQDDFEWYADASVVYLTNVTDSVLLFYYDGTYNLHFRGGSVNYHWPTADGTTGQFLTTNGSGTMTWTTSSGSGDITDVYNCASGDCATITMGASDTLIASDGSLLNFAAASVTTTTEGIILSQHATTCAAATAEGQVCWENDADKLWVGDGANPKEIGSGADTNADKEFWFPAPAMLPLESAESIPPIVKDAGTNTDMMTVDFDQTTDECRTVQLLAPPDITAGGTVTFTVVWYAASVTTNETVWDFRHNSGVADGVDPDQALTTEASGACTVGGTAGQIDVCTWTETQTNLAWAASDTVVGVLCRDADNAGDDFAADAKVIGFGIRIPRS